MRTMAVKSEQFIMLKKAITLVELIIGLAITAVLMSVVVVSFNSMEGRKLDVQARNMVANLIWAREIAASKHNNCTVVFDTGNERYSFYNGSISANNLVKNLSLSIKLDSVKKWDGTALSPAQIIFYSPQGNASSSAVITLNQTNRFRRVNISDETGFIKIE